MHMDSDQVLLASLTEDYQEGVMAFLEKRIPTSRVVNEDYCRGQSASLMIFKRPAQTQEWIVTPLED